jgi:hypothetical protein
MGAHCPQMTSTDFANLAIGWVTAIGTVAAVAIPVYFKIKAQLDENKNRIDQHDKIEGVVTTPLGAASAAQSPAAQPQQPLVTKP